MTGDRQSEALAREIVAGTGLWEIHRPEECQPGCELSGCRRARAILMLFTLTHAGRPLVLSDESIKIGILDAMSLDPYTFDGSLIPPPVAATPYHATDD